MVNVIKSKSFQFLILVLLINIVNAQNPDLLKQEKITQLTQNITTMFEYFLPKHPELNDNYTTIINNLENYAALLDDDQINQINSKIKEVMHFKNYLQFAYNYSKFNMLEKLSKGTNE